MVWFVAAEYGGIGKITRLKTDVSLRLRFRMPHKIKFSGVGGLQT
jgi:hypothetical protein